MAQWYCITIPYCKERKHSDEVLVTVDNGTCKRVIKAVYFPYHHSTVEDMGWDMQDGIPDDFDYVEKEDTWWIPQGWYEVCDYHEDYSYFTITDRVIAWSKLPKAYTPLLTDVNTLN